MLLEAPQPRAGATGPDQREGRASFDGEPSHQLALDVVEWLLVVGPGHDQSGLESPSGPVEHRRSGDRTHLGRREATPAVRGSVAASAMTRG